MNKFTWEEGDITIIDHNGNPVVTMYEQALPLIENRFTGFSEDREIWYCPKHAIERFWPSEGQLAGQHGHWQHAIALVFNETSNIYASDGHEIFSTDEEISCPDCEKGNEHA